jgi:MurNAc alpha-1-phosphate uridylyltransferase
MILAAGMGSRMRHLTAHTPKALLKVAGKSLIAYHLEKLAELGVGQVVINVSYLGEQIQAFLGDGQSFGLSIRYSVEEKPLETAGGLFKALPLLGDDAFICVNADVWTDFDFSLLVDHHAHLPQTTLADLLLVPNADHHPQGDFAIVDQRLSLTPPLQTFSGISILHPQLITQFPVGSGRLGDVFRLAIAANVACGLLYSGRWCDVGTPERLAQLESDLI